MSLPAPLMFTVGLIDQITKPIAKISNRLNDLSANYQAGTMQMASGIGGVVASGYSLFNALQPALEIDKALGEAKGAGLADASLKAITKTAMDFSLQYGKSAVEVIGHAEKMRIVLGNVPDNVLASATKSSATLAMAMKSDADTISKYIKNLTGNYADQANALGTSNFVAKIAGMTAYAKQQFGTELSELEGMIDGMHSLPSTLGVAMEEQFAVMAMLNKQMGQGDAVTQYTNYLEKIVASQDKLGVKLTDSNGRMLPIVETLEKLKPMLDGKSGDQAWKLLDDAGLGDGSLMIINMIKNLDSLKANINGFKNVKGLDPATKMAQAMTVQSERLSASWFAIRAAFGAAVLPAFNAFVGKIASMGESVIWFANTFPNITRWLGYLGIGLMLAVAAGGLFTIMMGAGKMAMTTWAAIAAVWNGAIWLVNAGLVKLRAVMLAVNIAMYANPIGFLIAGIGLAIVAVGAIIYYWDDLKATVSEWGWIKAVGDFFGEMITGIQNQFISFYNWIAGKLNTLPGVDIELKPIVGPVDTQKLQNATKLPENMPSQQAMPQWMQRQAANDTGVFSSAFPKHAGLLPETGVPEQLNQQLSVQRNLPAPYAPEPVIQQQHLQLVKPAAYVPEQLNQQLNVQRNLPKTYQPEPVTQQQHLQLVKPTAYVPEQLSQQLNVQRKLPAPYTPESLTQQLAIKPVTSDTLAGTITPKLNQQAAAAAQASRKASQSVNTGKTISFGDVIVQNPPKNWSLAELADQQELRTA